MSSSAIDMYPANPLPVVSIDTDSDVSIETSSVFNNHADSVSESATGADSLPTTAEWNDNLSQKIKGLWLGYRKNRRELGSALMDQKDKLAKEGYGKWFGFLRHAGIPRSSAERLIKGFERYLALPVSVRKLAGDSNLDLCKPSVLQAIEDEANAYELAGLSLEEAAELVKKLQSAEKPKRNRTSAKPGHRTKPATSSPGTKELTQAAFIGAISPTPACTQPNLEQLKSYVQACLMAITNIGLRREIADNLSEWIDLEFLGEPGQATAA